MHKIPIIFLSFVILNSCSEKGNEASSTIPTSEKENHPDTLVVDYSESEMDKAISKSKSRIQEFHDALVAKDADSYSVKAPITDQNGTEHFWLTDVQFKDGTFQGLIGNDPSIVKNVKFGQVWLIAEEEISDWMYMKSGMIHGGFTIDPLLSTYPKDEADALRARLIR